MVLTTATRPATNSFDGNQQFRVKKFLQLKTCRLNNFHIDSFLSPVDCWRFVFEGFQETQETLNG